MLHSSRAPLADSSPRTNRLLGALPPAEYELLALHLQPYRHELKQVVHQAYEPVTRVYFPQTGMISQLILTEEGDAIEVAVIGHEGMLGLTAVLGGGPEPYESLCQMSGDGVFISAERFRETVTDGSFLQRLLQRYTQAMLLTTSQGAACNRVHAMEERCARWLLQMQDRAMTDTFPLTHEFLAYMLGVRRATVTLAAQALQNAGLINYVRGQVTVCQRGGLEVAACSCYAVIRDGNEAVFQP